MMKFGFLAALALVSTGVQASELDGVTAANALVLSEINTQTQTVSKYTVKADETVSPAALSGLSTTERQARIDAFVKKTVRPENKISEERVEKAASELDGQGSSTSATWWRWRGGYYGHGYWGRGCYYRPVWNYGYYGYGAGYYGVGYYGGGYYGGYYGGGYYNTGCYYTLYSNGYYGW